MNIIMKTKERSYNTMLSSLCKLLFKIRQTPRPLMNIEHAKLKVNSKILLPKLLNKMKAGKTETMSMNP